MTLTAHCRLCRQRFDLRLPDDTAVAVASALAARGVCPACAIAAAIATTARLAGHHGPAEAQPAAEGSVGPSPACFDAGDQARIEPLRTAKKLISISK